MAIVDTKEEGYTLRGYLENSGRGVLEEAPLIPRH